MLLNTILNGIAIVVPVLISIAYYTLAERKVMGSIQRRKGPNVVGLWGLLQPLADGLKLVIKEIVIPRKSNIKLFVAAPIITFILSLLNWIVVPFQGSVFIDFNYGLLYLFAISGLSVYGVLLAGWASNSKYAFLGSLRAIAQMISYELTITLTIIPIILISGSLNLTDIIWTQVYFGYNCFFLLPLVIIFFISILAETNRAPFDLAEAEAEIVAGYNIEYSSIIFAMFFLGEYGNMIIMCILMVILFFGGWYFSLIILFWHPLIVNLFFAVKTIFFCFLFIVARAMLPRYRFDQLMLIGWKVFLPLTLGLLIFYMSILVYFEALPFYKVPFLLIN
jgi:NADH-quinone oxidoreductase subunit H